jgi:hypothetical protein
MASDPTGLYLFGFLILLIIAVFVYSFLSNRLAADKRKKMIHAFRASPTIATGAPILVQGPARAPDLLLPTTGEHVAFYALFVLSRESATTDLKTGLPIQIEGINLNKTRISAIKGFRFFETSGDFTVEQGETRYLVSVTSILASFTKGASMVTSFVGGQMKEIGLPGDVWNDAMNFSEAEPALKMLCGFEAPIGSQRSRTRSGTWTRTQTTQYATSSVVTVKSRIDSRIHYFEAGVNLPQAISDLIAKRGIVPEEKDEVIVVETFIPLNREVYVFGTFDGDKSIVFKDGTVRLSVSYADPEGE